MSTRTNQSADRALLVLMELSKEPATVAELSKRLELGRTVLNRLLATLLAHRFVVLEDRRYRLSSRLRTLAVGVDPILRSHIGAPASQLAAATGGSVLVTVRSGLHALVLTYIAPMSGDQIDMTVYQNARAPLVASVHGIAMLSRSAPSVRRRALAEALGEGSIRQSLDAARADGVAVGAAGTGLLPLREVSAPIIYSSGYADAAISLIFHADPELEQRARGLVRDVSRRVSDALLHEPRA